MLRSIAAQKELTCLELNLNNTDVELSEVVNLINAYGKMNKSLTELTLMMEHLEMDLKELKTILKSIGGIYSLSDLKLDFWITNKNSLNMLKSFGHLASLS